MSDITEAADKITKAKTQLVLRHTFFAIIALKLRWRNAVEAGLPFIDTMATDGQCVYYATEFVMRYPLAEITGVCAHEVMHCVLLHFARRGLRDPLLWNIAGDAVINQVLLDVPFKLPEDGIFMPQYKNWTTEKTYDDLGKQHEELKNKFSMPSANGAGQEEGKAGGKSQSQPGQGKGEKEGKGLPTRLWGTVIEPRKDDGSPLSEAEKTELQEEMRITILQAAEAAKAVGRLPGALQGLIKAHGQPTVNWKDYLQTWVKGNTPDNYTWQQPNRSMMANYGIYMPRMQLNGAGTGFLWIDNSGSVSDQMIQKFVTEITGVIELMNPDKLYIGQHDAKVQKVDVWEFGEEFDSLKIKGRGGTRIRPAFEYMKTVDEEIDWCICFTDMAIIDFPTADEAPDFPVLWAAVGRRQAPFGTYLPLLDSLEMGT